jgi:hypothetical protein
VDGYAGVWRDFAPFWRVEMGVAAQREKEAKSGGRLERKGGRGWFRERVEKRVSRRWFYYLYMAVFGLAVDPAAVGIVA